MEYFTAKKQQELINDPIKNQQEFMKRTFGDKSIAQKQREAISYSLVIDGGVRIG